ncbi:MAG TPA: hypothetical protein VK507_03660 [Iamia sp.]|nr:hypothetical protein [Iamia sp.]
MLDQPISPTGKSIMRSREVVYGVVGVMALGTAVYAVVVGWPQWWIPLLAGLMILVGVALSRYFRHTN